MMIFYSRLFLDISALPLEREPKYLKLYTIGKTRIEERCGAQVVDEDAQFTVHFAEDVSLADEAFEFVGTNDGMVIRGKSFCSLMFGLGRLLHSSRYNEQGICITNWRGFSAPDCPMRVIYFAIHFFNGYCAMAYEDLEHLLEDLMLWGINGVCAIFGSEFAKGIDDLAVKKGREKISRFFNAAKSLGMTTITLTGTTDGLNSNPAFAADLTNIHSKAGKCLCPSKPGALDYILEKNMTSLRDRMSSCGLDYVVFWPYDEGGCSCPQCAPWGGNGYYKWAKRQYQEMRQEFSNCPKAILSTWQFGIGCNDPRDFEWLDRAIREDKANGDDWVSYILLETDFGIPEYIQKHGVPGGVPAIDFPEITMYCLDPWGGFGANPLPSAVKRMWSKMSDQMHGGLCYSEGFYDDINKAVIAQLMWDNSRTTKEIFADYCAYEFCEEVSELFWEMATLMERNQERTFATNKQPPDMDEVTKIRDLGEQINEMLPEKIRTGWRWRLMYIRSVLDYERYTAGQPYNWGFDELEYDLARFHHWGKFLVGNEKAQKLLWELMELYKMPEVYDPDFHVLHFYIRPNHESNPAYQKQER